MLCQNGIVRFCVKLRQEELMAATVTQRRAYLDDRRLPGDGSKIVIENAQANNVQA